MSFFLLDNSIKEDHQTSVIIYGVHLPKSYARAPAQPTHLSSP
jgi:hypothetical protein